MAGAAPARGSCVKNRTDRLDPPMIPTRRSFLLGAAALGSLALAACARLGPRFGQPPAPPGPPWLSEHGWDHPLTGRIWRPTGRRFVEAGEALDQLAKADFVMLGEKHDNPDHHRLQAWTIAALAARGRRPAAAFEMLSADQEAALETYLAAHPGDASGLGAAVDWDKSGWPAWDTYAAVFQAALDAGAPILAANLARSTIQDVAKQGLKALGSGRIGRLGLDQAMPDALQSMMRQEIIEGHCDQLPATMIEPMVRAMTARDAHMADVLIAGAGRPGRNGAVLITGTGHARDDHGVPFHLRRLAPEARVVSLGFLEVDDLDEDPAAYAAHFGAEDLPFDLVWFTPLAERDDPCAAFAEQLRRAKERHKKER
ncbi:MAG: ChaN family lipoprotein, partial [Kiloniellales bacterium]